MQAAIKYWGVLTVLLVGTLLLMYFRPILARYGPSFGFTAAAVAMSDRVESTIFKVRLCMPTFPWTCGGYLAHLGKAARGIDFG